jgi:hypothetical protein
MPLVHHHEEVKGMLGSEMVVEGGTAVVKIEHEIAGTIEIETIGATDPGLVIENEIDMTDGMTGESQLESGTDVIPEMTGEMRPRLGTAREETVEVETKGGVGEISIPGMKPHRAQVCSRFTCASVNFDPNAPLTLLDYADLR